MSSEKIFLLESKWFWNKINRKQLILWVIWGTFLIWIWWSKNRTLTLFNTCKPKKNSSKTLLSQRVTVWYAISPFTVTGSLLFEYATVTVNTQHYCHMLPNFLHPKLWRYHLRGAIVDSSIESMQVVWSMFPGRVILCFGDTSWAPRSPDLSIYKFCFGDISSHKKKA